jgi:hypothetical protein
MMTICIITGISFEIFTSLRKISKSFSEWVLTAENHEQQNQCYAYPKILLTPPMEHQGWLHQPTWHFEKYMRYNIAFININYDYKAWERWLLAMTKWLISLILSHYSSSFEFVCQLIIAASDKKICIWKPADLKALTLSLLVLREF